MYQEFKAPLSVQIELTSKCNNHCIHCYNHWRKDNSSHAVIKKDQVVSVIKNLKESEVYKLLITGGEPMLYPDLLIETIKLAKANGLLCAVNSNVTLVTKEIAKRLKELKVSVLTSLLSYKQDVHDNITCRQGSFERTINGINILKKAGVHVGVNMVVMQSNIDQVYNTGKFVRKLGIRSFNATRVQPAQGCLNFDNLRLTSKEVIATLDDLLRLQKNFGMIVDSLTSYPVCLFGDLKKYERFLFKRSCSAGKTNCTIGANGEVRPCGHADEEFGNAFKESLIQIWPRLKKWRSGLLLPEECKKCDYFTRCGGGCRMDCKFYGQINSLDPYAKGKDFRLTQPPPEIKLENISHDTRLCVNSLLKFRQESFGVLLIIDGRMKSAVTQDSAFLLKKLKDKQFFNLKQVVGECGIEQGKVSTFFEKLLNQEVVMMFKKYLDKERRWINE